MPKINLTEKEALAMLQKIEDNGGNSSKVKKFLKPEPPKDATTPAADSISEDDAWVEAKWKEAWSVTGDDLVCFLCHKNAKELRCDACYDCFKVWALECKPKKKKGVKRGHKHSGNDRNMQPVSGQTGSGVQRDFSSDRSVKSNDG